MLDDTPIRSLTIDDLSPGQAVFQRLRFDREMLVNHHVLGRPAAHAPVMHLHQLDTGDLFATYVDVFDEVWAGASSVWRREAVA